MSSAPASALPRPALGIIIAVGLALAGWYLVRGPTWVAQPTRLSWTTAALDAGAVVVEVSDGGLEFLRVQDTEEPMLWTAAIRRGGARVELPDVNVFHAIERRGARLWVLTESQTEGPGPSLDLLLSEDEGRTFEQRAAVPKPSYLASFEALELDGDEVTLVLSLDDAVAPGADWAWGFWAWVPEGLPQPSLGPGRFALRSKNAGRTWRLAR